MGFEAFPLEQSLEILDSSMKYKPLHVILGSGGKSTDLLSIISHAFSHIQTLVQPVCLCLSQYVEMFFLSLGWVG